MQGAYQSKYETMCTQHPHLFRINDVSRFDSGSITGTYYPGRHFYNMYGRWLLSLCSICSLKTGFHRLRSDIPGYGAILYPNRTVSSSAETSIAADLFAEVSFSLS